jgi:transcriptional regulator with XRE-family HTH domain
MDELAQAIGARVRAARAANRQTQTVVAGLAGITADYLYQIERGKKRPALPVLIELARVLGMPLEQLLDQPSARPADRLSTGDAGVRLYQALTRPITIAEPPSVSELHQHIRLAWQDWQTSPRRYSKLSNQLPLLITSTERAVRWHQADDERPQWRAAQRCSADLYGLLRTVAKRVGRVDLSLLVADRALRAAENAEDPHRLATARWNLAHVLLSDQQPEGGEAVAMQAADELAPLVHAGDLDATALSGALILLGAVASARQGEVWTARERVQSVVPLAVRTGERNVYWTAFGPVNVAMYAVSIEVEAGEAVEALRLAERIDHDQSPSIERRVAFLLEQAKGYIQRCDYGSALAVLQTASHEAPEDVTYRPAAHRLVSTVIRRASRGVATEAARLATRAGLTIG